MTLAVGPSPSLATEPSDTQRIADLSIEELMNVKVVSVAKKPQKLSDAAAAIYVISNEDIRRSGARNIPEALRLAPGVDVAEIGGGSYAVGIRGFGGRFANKLLVLQDGRSLYTQLFSGVFWEVQMPLLDDVERIEVIRGPGAAIWGANAVNGVINIITRSSAQSLGGLATVATGQNSYREGALRYGGRLDDDTTVRTFARGASLVSGAGSSGSPDGITLNNASGGLRLDRNLESGRASLDVQAYRASNDQPIIVPAPTTPYVTDATTRQQHDGAFANGRWERDLAEGASFAVQAYFDHSHLKLPGFVSESHDIADLDVQYRVHPAAAHDVVVGFGLRSDKDTFAGSTYIQVSQPGFAQHTYSLRLQDEITLLPYPLRLTLGTSVEQDSQIGTHALPDVRLAWSASPTVTLWGAASRAIRAPSRIEQNIQFITASTIPAQPPYQPLPTIVVASGTPGFGVENETAYQLGLRLQPTHDLSIDLTAYESRYRNLRTNAPVDPALATLGLQNGVPYIRLPILLVNGLAATTRGVEGAVDWRASDWWRLQVSASHMNLAIDHSADREGLAGSAPKNLFSLRSSMDLGPTRFDAWLRHVDSRLATPVTTSIAIPVPAYDTLDLRLAWNPVRRLELAVEGKNLLQSHHLEYVPDELISAPLDITRSVYVSARLAF